jgi:hypothetical protein
MKPGVTCTVLMLALAPLVACATAVCLEPSRWGGSINPVNIIGMALFGLVTVPLWPTYIPSLILTPLVMRRVARSQYFRTMHLSLLIGISFLVGAIAGSLVLIPLVLMSLKEPKLAMSWAIAGGLAGSVTLCVIVLIYRRGVHASATSK